MKKDLMGKIRQNTPSNAKEMKESGKCKGDGITYCVYLLDQNCPRICDYAKRKDLNNNYNKK